MSQQVLTFFDFLSMILSNVFWLKNPIRKLNFYSLTV